MRLSKHGKIPLLLLHSRNAQIQNAATLFTYSSIWTHLFMFGNESARSETQNRQSPQQSPVVLERSSVPGSRGFHFCWNNQYWSRCSNWSSFSCYNTFLDIPRGIWEVMSSNPVGDFTFFWPFLILNDIHIFNQGKPVSPSWYQRVPRPRATRNF